MDSFLKSDKLINFYNRMATGSLIEKQRVHFSQFLDFELPMPSTGECEKIAEIISTWDKGIELKEQLIAQKKQQKKWLMQNLITGEKRLPGFNGEWQEVSLGRIGGTYTGLSGKSKDDFGYGKYYIPYKYFQKLSD